jgi:IstB-like ATP binding protein
LDSCPSGTGKTMLATALAVCACHQGRRVRFTTLAGLANELQEAQGSRELARVVGRYARTELVVLDELGYLALPDGAAELVLQVLSERHERGSLIVTTNLPFGEWTKVFPDPRLAKAVVDRLTHRAHIIDTGNESWRFRHGLRKKQADPPPNDARASYCRSALGLRPQAPRQQLATPPPPHQARSTKHNNPTRRGATSSHRAGASASRRFHEDADCCVSVPK